LVFGIASGVGFGAALGTAFHNVGLGIAVGVGFGVALGSAFVLAFGSAGSHRKR
jgi:zinc transporter ZupT